MRVARVGASCAVILALWLTAEPATGQTSRVREVLAMGDSAIAVTMLRAQLRQGSLSPTDECLLAMLLTRLAPAEATDWQERIEAEALFERSLRGVRNPLCLLEFSTLRSRQGMRVDAGRLASRAFDLIVRDTSFHMPAVMAEVYYRRALPLLAWIRQFEHLVHVTDLPVSSPTCRDAGLFCEAYAHADEFYARLARGERLDDLVETERATAEGLLDSALALHPAHPDALRAALWQAAARDNWARFASLTRQAYAAEPDAAAHRLGVMTAALRTGHHAEAAAWFDSVQSALGPDALARFEGLALVADTSLRDKLAGEHAVIYAEAIWGLSDPLYLSGRNERRIEHYARVYLAEILFSDPERGRAGRDTPQGRLLIRYGLPHRIFVVPADQSRKLSDAQREMMDEILACATQPIVSHAATNRREASEPACAHGLATGHGMEGSGRWEFWYYTRGGAPFIFERALGSWTVRHMFESASLRLDSLMHATTPSNYEPPLRNGSLQTLISRFPRPDRPVVEIWGRFRWDESATDPSRYTRLGFFLHDPDNGRLLSHAVLDARPRHPGESRFQRRMPVPWGTVRLAVEAALPLDLTVAAQDRHRIRMSPPVRDSIWMSDILPGEHGIAPGAAATREDVEFLGLSDSIIPAGSSLALYWETYGTRADASRTVQLEMRLDVTREADGGVVPPFRWLARTLGIVRSRDNATVWTVTRPAADVLPEVVTLESLDVPGDLRITITVTEIASGRSASSSRVVSVRETSS